MNTDGGFVVDLKNSLTPEQIREIRELLDGVQGESFDRFIERVRHPVSAYRAHVRAHATIPNAKEQARYLRKLENKLSKLRNLVNQVDELLNDAPAELRRAARRSNSPVNTVQSNLTNMLLALNDVVPPTKSKYRPETLDAAMKIHAVFREALNVEPQILAYRLKSDVPATAAAADRFVPVLAVLMNVSLDYAYRIAGEILPS